MKIFFHSVLAAVVVSFVPLARATAVADQVDKLSQFDLTQVRLLESAFKEAQTRDQEYLLSLDPDRFLLMFRVTAGLASAAVPYGGWESPGGELRGHSLGHYLSACSLMYSSTGDERLKERVAHIVADLAKCQDAMTSQGAHAGYLSAFPESLFDRVDAQKPVWAPWYTLHKIMAGLLDAHVRTGNAQALDVLTKLTDWVKFRVDRLSPEQMQGSLKTEHGGMNEVLANVYGLTGRPEYLKLAEDFNHQAVFGPLAKGVDALDKLHANTQIPKIIGAAREYELTGKTEYRDIAQFFWQEVALKRSYAIGGDSDNEHFFPVTDFAKHLTPVTAETCNTYNMLKLTEHLFSWNPSAPIMDFYERGLYNQILASQDPHKGQFAYFISLKPGHFKTYSTPENSFWCCVGTGMENHAKYGEMIYAHRGADLFVNLFIPSELNWKEPEITVRQDTHFPEEPATRFHFELRKPATFAVHFRKPGWLASAPAIKINGQTAEAKAEDFGYITLQREWTNGDTVELTLPMALRTEPLPGAPKIVAFFYGPILLAGALGKDGMPEAGAYAVDQQDYAKWPVPLTPTLSGEPSSVLQALKPVAGQPLTFKTEGVGHPKDVTLIPFYQLHHQRYTVYWSVGAASAVAEK